MISWPLLFPKRSMVTNVYFGAFEEIFRCIFVVELFLNDSRRGLFD